MPFTQKIIKVSFSSGGGGSPATGGSSFSGDLSFDNLRTTCHVVAGGQNTLITLDLLVYGMTLSHQNQISTLGWKGQRRSPDSVTVFAGDKNGLSMVYKGTIWAAYSDFQGGPNVPLHVIAHSGTRESGLKANPTSINNKSADVAQIMQDLAGKMGLQFENNGVNVKIAYPYLAGDPKRQAWALAEHANIDVTIDRDKLAINPADGSRSGSATVGPSNGLVGYPSWAQEGIRLKTVYLPDLMLNGNITVEGSSITPANGTWKIVRLEHSLQSFTPNGEWFSNIVAWQPKAGQTEPTATSG